MVDEPYYILPFYNYQEIIFNPNNHVNIITKNEKYIDASFEKKLRYGILTSDMDDSSRSSLLELFNSKENVNGEYCQILITVLLFWNIH